MRYCANVWFCSDALINKSNAFFLFSFIPDRKSTRLNSSHSQISYAVFCLKKKNSDVRSAGYPPIVGFCRSNGFGPAWISGLGTVEPLFQHALPLHADAQRVLNSNVTSAALFKRSLHAGH